MCDVCSLQGKYTFGNGDAYEGSYKYDEQTGQVSLDLRIF
jgi:hypothetical protein